MLLAVPVHAITIGVNINLVPTVDHQLAEPTIAVDPRNPSITVAGAQDYNFDNIRHHRWHAYYRSIDGGQTWTSSLLPGYPGDTSPQGQSSPLRFYNLASDPVLTFDNDGNVYYAGVALNLTSTGGATDFVAKFTDDGANYAGVTLIPGFGDYPKIAVDRTGGPFTGNIYLTSTNGFSVSADRGATFTTPSRLPGFPSGITVAPDGTVYITTTFFPPRTGPTNILVTKSTDGGRSLQGHELAAFNITTVPFEFPGNQFREFTLPEIAADTSTVYIVWADYRTGDSNILLVRSTDAGLTWTTPITINDVTLGQQFTPTITASNGIVSIAWYDDRLSTTPLGTMNALDVFYAQSQDHGQTFSANLRVTSTSFNPNQARIVDFARGAPFLGDYISISAGPSFVQPVWSDQRNACDLITSQGCVDEDIFTATITV